MADGEEVSLRAQVRTWMDEAWDPDLTVGEWWRRLSDSGWAFPTWPHGHGGRALAPASASVVASVLAEGGVLGPPGGLGQLMGAPIVLAHGLPEQRERWVPALSAGTESWCQLFSEPNAGSDLANVQTTAVRDGDRWVVNGQKVWTSNAEISQRGMLLARTDSSVPKHSGLSYFILDMRQVGVEIRALRQMDGSATFNEVFLSNVVVDTSEIIGAPGDGWRVAMATLQFERSGIAGGGTRGGIPTARPGPAAGEIYLRVGDVVETLRSSPEEELAMAGSTTPDAMIALAQEFGRNCDPVIRQRLASFYIQTEVLRLTRERSKSPSAGKGQPGAVASVLKLAMGALSHASRDIAYDLMGPSTLLMGDDAGHGGVYQKMGLRAHRTSIAGGSDQIQRNIVGERVLGLPPEPRVDRNVPYRDLPK